MSQYTGIAQRALALVAKKGAAVVFSKSEGGTYDAATDTTTTAATLYASGAAVQVRGDPTKYLALGLIQLSPVTLLFAPTIPGALPDLDASVQWGGASYVVKDVSPTAPDGTAIVARVICTGGGRSTMTAGAASLARTDITFATSTVTFAAA